MPRIARPTLSTRRLNTRQSTGPIRSATYAPIMSGTDGREPTTARDRVIDAALACFAEQGVRSTTLETVANRAGIHRVTLHRLFPDGRRELVRAAIERSFEGLAAPTAAALARTSEPDEKVTDILIAGITFLRTDPVIAEVLSSEDGRAAITGAAGNALLPLVAEAWDAMVAEVEATGWDGSADAGPEAVLDHVLRTTTTLASDPSAPQDEDRLRWYLDQFVTPGLVRPR